MIAQSNQPSSDQIQITGLRAFAHHGVLAHERENGQEFIVDVRVMLDLEAAAESDDLDKTINYGELAEEIVASVESNPVDLLETVAKRIVDVVLAHQAAVLAVVTVHKPNAPIAVPFDDVSVTLTRGRS